MKQHALKNENNCLNADIYSYLETFGGQSSNPYKMLLMFQHQCELDICGTLIQFFLALVSNICYSNGGSSSK